MITPCGLPSRAALQLPVKDGRRQEGAPGTAGVYELTVNLQVVVCHVFGGKAQFEGPAHTGTVQHLKAPNGQDGFVGVL
jgi:hypothetical protein